MFERLESKNIVLRKAKESDWKSMLKYVWGAKDVYKWMLFAPTLTEEDAIERCQRSINFQKDHYGYFVALKDTDEAIGLCAIREYEEGRIEECGICMGTKFQGKGYGKEIVNLLLDLAFNKLNAKDFLYGYYFDNEKSKKLAKHYGFKYNHTETIVRPWDGETKKVKLCLLTKEAYDKYSESIK